MRKWTLRAPALAALIYGMFAAASALAERNAIHPFTWLGWVREHVLVGVALVGLGAIGLGVKSPRQARLVAAALALIASP